MFTLSSQFGGLLSRPEPHLIGPNRARSLSNANLDTGAIQPQAGVGSAAYTGGAGTYRSIYKFGSTWVANLNTTAWQYVEFDSWLIRAAAGTAPQKSADGTTWRQLGITAPAGALTATVTGTAGNPSGSYYYYYTYVTATGAESAPSPISAVATTAGSFQIDLSSITASADAQVTTKYIYRVGGTVSTINRIASIANATTTYADNIGDVAAAAGAILSTAGYGVPGNLEGIAVAPHMGRLFGWIGNTFYWTEAGLIDAWSAANFQDVPDAIKAMAAYAGSMLVLTSTQPILVLGNTPDASTGFPTYAVPAQQGCLDRDTCVDMGHSIFYLSNDGVCAFAGRDVDVISKAALSDSLLATPGAASPTNAKAVRYNERYILFFQSGTSFSSGGYVTWDPRVDGNWTTGTLTATAVHYNRAADTLYVAQGANIVYPWEGGSAVAGSYRTGAWIEKSISLLKHWTQVAVDHTGDIALTVTIDGVDVISGVALSQGATVGRSRYRLPAGCRGRSIDITISWSAAPSTAVKVAEILDNIERKALKL